MIEVKKKQAPDGKGKVIMLGEPIRPSSPFYDTAKQFKEVVRTLGITGSSVTKELHARVLPGLLQIPSSLEGTKVRLLVTVEVTYEDGRVEQYDARPEPVAAVSPTRRRAKNIQPVVISEPIFRVTPDDGRRGGR